MGDETRFPASEKVPGQGESRRAYQDFIQALDAFVWWQDYRELRELGWDWRKAAFIAWAASPIATREPATQDELAVQVLGLSSDRVIRKWRIKFPEMDDQIAVMQAAPLLRHRRDVFDALAESAATKDYHNHADRKLFLEMTGDYSRNQAKDLAEEPTAPEYIQQMIEKVYGGQGGGGGDDDSD